MQVWSYKPWKYTLCDRTIYKGHRKGTWRPFLQGGKGLCWLFSPLFFVMHLFLRETWWYTYLSSKFFIISLLSGCFLFSCRGASYTYFPWFCICYNGQCWRCWAVHQVSQPVSSRRPLHNCGEGNVVLPSVTKVWQYWVVFFLLDLEVFWLYSECLASAMLAAIKDDEFIHVNLVKQLDQWQA